MDLGDEAPAVVDLLTDGFEPTPEAVPATVLDLAARRWLTIEQYGDAPVLVRLRSEGKGLLRPFEQQVLDHLRGLAVDGVVPAAALTTGPEAVSAKWWARFRRAVIAEARAHGLCRSRWVGLGVVAVWAGAVAAFVSGWVADGAAGEATGPRLVDLLILADFGAGFALAGIAAGITSSDRQRDTAEGLEVAGRWLGVRQYLADHGDFATKPAAAVALWDRYLAYAAALDLAALATAQLPLGAEDDRNAWSRAAGQWRHVIVSYPRLRPGYGQRPLVAIAVGLLTGAATGIAGVWLIPVAARTPSWIDDLPPDAATWVTRVAAVLVAAFGTIAAWSAVKVCFGARDLFAHRTVEGTVLRARTRETGDWLPGPLKALQPEAHQRRRRHFVAVDDGTRDQFRAWRVTSDRYRAAVQGNHVRVVVTPALGYVRSIERSPHQGREPDEAAEAAADDPALVAAARALPRS